MKHKTTTLAGILLGLVLSLCMASPAKAATVNFTDVPKDAYYFDAVQWAVNHEFKITSGTSATTFGSNDPCTRGQVMTFLWRSAGCPEPASDNNPFTDVKEGDYFHKAVLWAVEKKITSGTSATTFGPNDHCTRAQVMTFLWHFEGDPEPEETDNPFTDVEEQAYYRKPVRWAVGRKITSGTSFTTFDPHAQCSRAQIMTFLYKGKLRVPSKNGMKITSLMHDHYVYEGEYTFNEVEVEGGTKPYTYQWYVIKSDSTEPVALVDSDSEEGADSIKGAKTNLVKLFNTTMDYDNAKFYCEITDAKGDKITSDKITLTVIDVKVTIEPKELALTKGSEAVFTVTVKGGTEPYTYQWYCKDTRRENGGSYTEDGEIYSGSNTDTLRFTVTDTFYERIFFCCDVTDANGKKASSEYAKIIVKDYMITEQPKDVTVYEGEDATFSVKVSGGAEPYEYVWYGEEKNGDNRFTELQHSSDPTLTIKGCKASDNNTWYYCHVWDANNIYRDSETVLLTVKKKPSGGGGGGGSSSGSGSAAGPVAP